MLFLRSVILRGIFLIILAPLQAYAIDDAELSRIVAQRITGDRTAACLAVAVVEKASVARAYTCADPGKPSRVDAMSAFEIGSVSKTMTAALLADLIEQKHVSLDDPLAKYLPDGSTVPDFQGKPVLLRHLVSHTSGLPRLPHVLMADADAADPYAAITPDKLLAALASSRIGTEPGTVFEYSNFGGMLLSLAVARRAGSDFETLLTQSLFKPLGMKGAYVTRVPEGIRAAAGHLPTGASAPAWNFNVNLAGVGGVRATLDDMVRYVQAQLGQSDAAIMPALRLTQQPVPTAAQPSTAMNWMLMPLNGKTWLAHEGGTGGFSSFVAFQPELQRGVVVLADTSMTALGGLGSLGLHLADASVPLGKPRRTAKAPAALLDALSGEYTLATGLDMRLAREGDTLVAYPKDQPPQHMAYDDAGDFYPQALDGLLQPVRRADGSQSFVWHQGGGQFPAKRKQQQDKPATPAPDASQLRDYAGRYPLQTGFDLQVREHDGVLRAQATGQGEFSLQAAAKDVFEAPDFGIEIRFLRDKQGLVQSLELHQAGQVLKGERR